MEGQGQEDWVAVEVAVEAGAGLTTYFGLMGLGAVCMAKVFVLGQRMVESVLEVIGLGTQTSTIHPSSPMRGYHVIVIKWLNEAPQVTAKEGVVRQLGMMLEVGVKSNSRRCPTNQQRLS